ncbi:tetratricopeptide repeat protein [bacterium]|nr:MAG: tetratricopeptide repeat protein [bacterium]
MKRALHLTITAVILIAVSGCGSNKQVRQSTLEDEALRYSTRFQKDFSLGRYGLALNDAQQAVQIYRSLDRDRDTAISLNNLGVIQERLGRKEEAEAAYREALSLARSADDARTVVSALNNLAGMLADGGTAEAVDLANEAMTIARDKGWTEAEGRAVHTLAMISLGAGDMKRAEELGRQALKLTAGTGGGGSEAACLATLARISALSDDFDTAMEQINGAIAIDRDRGDPYAIAMDYRTKAFVQDLTRDMEGAEESLEKAEGIMEFLGLEGGEISSQ